MTSAYFGSPRGLVSYCNTYPCHPDTVEVWGSSPHGPTIFSITSAACPSNTSCFVSLFVSSPALCFSANQLPAGLAERAATACRLDSLRTCEYLANLYGL